MRQRIFELTGPAKAGAIAVGIAIAISSFGVVRAEHYAPDKKKTVFNCNSGTACLTGNSTGSETWGVFGAGASADGIHGITNSTSGSSGVAGIQIGSAPNGHGVYGKSSAGIGVYGTSSTNVGVYGTSAGFDGVEGSATGSDWAGVYGNGNGGNIGVWAESASSGEALYAQADKSDTSIFYGFNAATGSACAIDADANLTCTGSIGSEHRSGDGQRVVAYAAESASATIEDVGTARLNGGTATVRIEPAFASIIDHKWYYVFLTPLGDTRGLYVSIKTPYAFEVRENERGHSSTAFDYRIIAHPLGAGTDRLPPAPSTRRPAAQSARR